MLKRITPLFVAMLCTALSVSAQGVTFLGHLPYADQLSNLTGWSDGAGHEYAIVGTFDGTSIVDITDPTTPVEVQFIDGNNSIWREVRTYGNYAYVVTEAGGGLLCIDLSNLPGSVDFNYTDCGIGLNTGHTVFCDENGIVHVFGSNIGNGGDQMLDATIDPLEPEFVGEVDEWYVHDGYVRGDTLWAANIYDGWFSVWDISDKSSPELWAQQNTPDDFTHNVWLTDDNKFLFSTDEVNNAVIASYDVSDLTDIIELDQFQANPGTNSIPHNVMVVGDYLVTAYYRDGVVVTDASDPTNMIKIGEYDTSPLSGGGFNGAWGAWPYLPSTNIIVSDMEEGLFIVGVEYAPAAYVMGDVTDAETGAPLFGVEVNYTGDVDAITDLVGHYSSGTSTPGVYDFTFTKPGYETEIVTGITLVGGDTVIVDAELTPLVPVNITGQVIDAATGLGAANADVIFQNLLYTETTTTDADGNFSLTMFTGDYAFIAGKWGLVTNGIDVTVTDGGFYTITLNPGYYDDFIFTNDWTTTDLADSGDWEKGEPNGTAIAGGDFSNPENDVDTDFGSEAFVTGNDPDDAAATDDVDNGAVFLTSPVMDLSTYVDPQLNYYRWFYNGGGGGSANDTLKVFISNGATEVQVDAIRSVPAALLSQWNEVTIDINNFLPITSTMQVRFRTADQAATGHLVEAGVDVFRVYDSITAAPTAVFTAENTTGCAPLTVTFDDNSVGATAWSWEFPGGTPSTSTLQNPTIVYNTPGVYDVTLTASNDLGDNEVTTTAFVTAELCNSINELSNAGISLYPNPVMSFVTISIEHPEATQLVVYDVTGREVLNKALNGNQQLVISVAELPAGVYRVQVSNNETIFGSTEMIKVQ